MDNVAGGSEHVTVSGRKRHVAGYLRDFLFPGEQLRSPVRTLSGGERNRLLLARLFAQPANLLVLDEPTNDLDVETLELLEELVANFAGTLLLVSHDRAFLDNVVSSTLVFEGSGKVTEYVGGYSDWLRQRPAEGTPWAGGRSERSVTKQTRPEPTASPPPDKPRKLSYKEQRELDALPARIEALEAEQTALESRVNDPGFYARHREEIEAELERLAAVSAELETCYGRWEALEAIGARPALARDTPG
jgi:ATP-binding cassette subfamily F protein uup